MNLGSIRTTAQTAAGTGLPEVSNLIPGILNQLPQQDSSRVQQRNDIQQSLDPNIFMRYLQAIQRANPTEVTK